ncbi:MAG: BlaI/MecI/CopY family transcriptional regulator [Eubacteriales bacterium]|nr:BlaI/MecI/CopY family transcriptional regulator [Eubacteriales bacterium]MDD3198757.1 BlaI/MecI/CopY family transcriptional regulator [Eubacteriales bacterium]MDD4121460.1 BlaI/MecI/CopY family transcriptional regulator [Eubacteriales bacterium]MDD4628997.1 BlaI/MecI/CopY family transcriptional regulator [Eubacteriales bacterium]
MQRINLSDGEWSIMNALWEEAPKTITQLTAGLKESTAWSKHTIITMLGRMESKGAVRYEQGIRAKQYYPAVERAETVLGETESFLDKVYSGSLGLMVNTMVEKNSLSKEEIDELYAILKKAEEEEK